MDETMRRLERHAACDPDAAMRLAAHRVRVGQGDALAPGERWALAVAAGSATWRLALSDGYPLAGCHPVRVVHLAQAIGWVSLRPGVTGEPSGSAYYYTPGLFRRWERTTTYSNPHRRKAKTPANRRAERAREREAERRRAATLTRAAQWEERKALWLKARGGA